MLFAVQTLRQVLWNSAGLSTFAWSSRFEASTQTRLSFLAQPLAECSKDLTTAKYEHSPWSGGIRAAFNLIWLPAFWWGKVDKNLISSKLWDKIEENDSSYLRGGNSQYTDKCPSCSNSIIKPVSPSGIKPFPSRSHYVLSYPKRPQRDGKICILQNQLKAA
jgi:hypothetical protein